MRFVIPVVFYEITNAECEYSSNTTVFIGRIFYIKYNYMFRRLIMAIFRLYMKSKAKLEYKIFPLIQGWQPVERR